MDPRSRAVYYRIHVRNYRPGPGFRYFPPDTAVAHTLKREICLSVQRVLAAAVARLTSHGGPGSELVLPVVVPISKRRSATQAGQAAGSMAR
jgi:hypothetical protein